MNTDWHSPLDSAKASRHIADAARENLNFVLRGIDGSIGAVIEPDFVAAIHANVEPYNEAIAMKFRPLHDRVLVRRIDEEARTSGGIIIPDTAKEKPQQGEIVAAGPGSRGDNDKLIALDVKVGDRVLFGKWSGTEVKIGGEELLIMKEADILGVLEGSASAKQAA